MKQLGSNSWSEQAEPSMLRIREKLTSGRIRDSYHAGANDHTQKNLEDAQVAISDLDSSELRWKSWSNGKTPPLPKVRRQNRQC